ncbi:MAG: hypothetical protein O3A51_02895, partial [Verrucomicrobia bacterium]|nr:hypothetical protein [Verrucomicrobiota bacterium]
MEEQLNDIARRMQTLENDITSMRAARTTTPPPPPAEDRITDDELIEMALHGSTESFRIARDDARGRARYREYVRERIGEERDARKRAELDAERKPLRRGWFLGGEAFERKLLKLIGRKVAGGAHDAPRGEMRRAHGQDVAIVAHVLAKGVDGHDHAKLTG